MSTSSQPTRNRDLHVSLLSTNPKQDPEPDQSPTEVGEDLQNRLLPPVYNIRKTKWRWFALSLVCFTSFALYYCYNNPQGLQPSLEAIYNLNDVEFNILYSIYSLPNIILPFFGGMLADRFGVRFAINIFGFILMIGQGVFTLGSYIGNFHVMVFGRFIFGVGGESFAVCQLPMVSKWFSTTELSFAWGFGRAAVRVGSSLNSFFTPRIYMWTGTIWAPLLVGTVITFLSWLSGLVLNYMDKLAERQEGLQNTDAIQDKKKFHLRDLKKLPFLVLLLLLNYCFLYGSFFGFTNNINDLMVKRFGFDMVSAGNLIMIIYLFAAFIGIFFAKLLDKYGKRIRVLILAAILFLSMELFVAFLSDGTPEKPNYAIIVALFGISMFYSVYSTIFSPCLALIVEKRMLATANGIITAFFNLTLTLLPLVLGYVHDKTIGTRNGYFWTEITLSGVILVGVLVSFWIYYVDGTHGKKLDTKPGKKTEEEKDITKRINLEDDEEATEKK